MSTSDLHPTKMAWLQWLKHTITMVRTSSVTIAIFDIRALATGGNLAAEGEVILVAVSRTTLVDMSIDSRYCLYLFIVPSEFILRPPKALMHCLLWTMVVVQLLRHVWCIARTGSKQVGLGREIRNIQGCVTCKARARWMFNCRSRRVRDGLRTQW